MKRITKHLNPTNLMVVAALIFAMAGGAVAASSGQSSHLRHDANVAKRHGKAKRSGKRKARYVISSTKQIKPSVVASLRGKNGVAGRGRLRVER